jgi:RNA polymerase sigma factor (sigma-70 family)
MASEAEDPRVAFCRREHPRLVGALSLYCGDSDVALELAQEALARACRDWGRVSQMAAPGAWTHRVAINLANRTFRRRAAERAAQHRQASGPPAPHEPDHADAIAVRAAVVGLPRRQRTALVLRYYSDLPVAEVAELMSCSQGTVKALTHQAVAALRARSGLVEVEEVPGV